MRTWWSLAEDEAPAPRRPGEPSLHTREHIVAAAEQLILDQGFAAATTKAIAERAGCAEGSIYRHFADKRALFLELMGLRLPAFMDVMETLPARAGIATVQRNLEETAVAALRFYRGIMPMVGGAIAEHKLLLEQRRQFEETKVGPMRSFGLLSAYIRKEQRLGRVSDGSSPENISRLLLGACWAQAFLRCFLGEDATVGSDQRFARDIVRALRDGLNPRNAAKEAAGR
jgi:AcrR family transcriptional regulator